MNERKPVRKAVVAAAGFGTRFLPQTKAMPKSMLPLVDKPIIQYVVEELVASGITDIIMVTDYHKRIVEDHFDSPNAELVETLEKSDKQEALDTIRKIPELANIAYVRQKEVLGNVGPVYFAQEWLGDEPFIYTWSDDFISATPPRFKQMIDAYKKYGTSIISCVELYADDDYDKYGIVAGQELSEDAIDVTTIIEKPGKKNAPSNLASVSGFLLTPDIFPYLNDEVRERNRGVDTQIQPVIQQLIDGQAKVTALKIKNGKFYDAGNKLEYLKTVVDFALMHDDLKEDFSNYLRSVIK